MTTRQHSTDRQGKQKSGPPEGRPKGTYTQTVRVLRLVRLLASRQWSAGELADEFGISERHLYRDLVQIEAAGYPLEREKADDGRVYYRLPLGHKGIPPLSLSPEELMSLYLAKSHLTSLRGTPFNDDLDRIFNRIKAEQTDRTANHVERIVKTFFPLVRPVRDYTAKREVLDRLREALLRQFRVVIRHQVPDADQPAEHVVDPYVLVAYKNGLYVIGHSFRAKALRHFAVERIHQVTVTHERFDLPASFDAVTLDRQLFGILAGPPVRVRIRFSQKAAYLVKERQFHPTQTLIERKDGSIDLLMTAGGLEEIANWVLSWGSYAQALSPPQLVRAVRDQLDAARRLYGTRP